MNSCRDIPVVMLEEIGVVVMALDVVVMALDVVVLALEAVAEHGVAVMQTTVMCNLGHQAGLNRMEEEVVENV